MMNYKLIKLEQGYIIISDEKEIINDYIKTPYNEIYKIIGYNNGIPIDKNGNGNLLNNKKIIASTFIPELPTIDFNGLEEEIGVIDVGNLELQYYKELEERKEIAKNFKGQVAGRHEDMFEHKEMHHMVRGYLEGFNKCLELNKDKLYTLEELRFHCTRFAYTSRLKGCITNDDTISLFDNEYKQSLQPKKEWNIKIEMQTECYCDHTIYCDCGEINEKPFIQVPKITNNSIKILKNE